MPQLLPPDIEALKTAAIACGLSEPQRRSLLFTGLPATIVAHIPTKDRPADQVEADLVELDKLSDTPEASGVPPLAVWLENAHRNAGGRAEGQVFVEYQSTVEQRRAAARQALIAGLKPKKLITATDKAFDKVLKRKPILWVGAGLSLGAGYPSTGALVEAIRDRAEPGDIPDALEDFTAVVDAFLEENSAGELHNVLDERFRTPRQPTAVHEAIAQLARGGVFAAIVTTNYDDLIERALSAAGVPFQLSTLEQNAHLQPSDEALVVAKIHGSREDWSKVILSGEAYGAFQARYAFLTQKLDVWMTQHPFLFVGCSMQDPRLIDWLRTRPEGWTEKLSNWRPLMTAADWDKAWAAAPGPLSAKSIRPLVIGGYGEAFTQLWANAAHRRAPRFDDLELRLTVDGAGWAAELGEHRWRVDDPLAGALDDPAGKQLRDAIETLRKLDYKPLPTDGHGGFEGPAAQAAAMMQGLAASIGDELTAALLPAGPAALVRQAVQHAQDGDPPLLRLRVRAERPEDPAQVARADHALALPWELLRVDGRFPVEAGTLDIAREAVVDELAGPPAATEPLTVVATVAAPVDATRLDYEDECYRLWQALGSEERRLLLTDRGTVDDLVDAVVAHRPPVVHFTGHGLPGKLLFEDEAARSHQVEVNTLIDRLRGEQRGRLPRVMFLAACHGASLQRRKLDRVVPVPDASTTGDEAEATREAGPRSGETREQRALRLVEEAAFTVAPSTAATLNRAGLHTVVGYFGPVGDAQSTRIEAAFYGALAAGETPRQAVRRGRAIAARPHGTSGKYTHRYPLGWAQLALYHRGADQAAAVVDAKGPRVDIHRAALQRRTERLDKAGSTDDGVVRLAQGFIGRRSPRAEVIRKWLGGPEDEPQRVVVVQGLGGLGKTTLCAELVPILARRMAPHLEGGAPLLALDGTAARDRSEPIEALWEELQHFDPDEGRWDKDAWQTEVGELTQDGLTGAGLAKAIISAAERCRGLLVYLDDTESLLRSEGDLRAWADPESAAFWQTLSAACQPGGPLGLLASTRYVPHDTPPEAIVRLPGMGPADIVRLSRWLKHLRRLPAEDAGWLAERIDGHPRTVQFLEPLVAKAIRVWALQHDPDRGYTGGDWRADILVPALAGAAEEVHADLLLPSVWEALDEPARAHLGACSVLTQPVPWGAVASLGEGDTAQALADVGLLSPATVASEPGRWWAPHGLVRAMVETKWGGDVGAAHQTVGRWLAEAAGAAGGRRLVGRRAIEHLFAGGAPNEAWPVVYPVVLSLRHAGRSREALSWVARVLDHAPTGEALGNALVFRVQLGRIVNTLPETPVVDLERAVTLLGEAGHSFVLNELGKLHQRQGRLVDAAEALTRSAAVGERVHGAKSKELSSTLHALAGVLFAQGDLGGARERLERSLRIAKAVLGTEEHPSVAASLHELARVLQAQGDLAGARDRLERSLRIKAAVFGTEEHPDVAASLHSLAGVLQAQGDLAGARERLERSLRISAAVFGTEEHPSVAASLHSLAGVLQAQGDLAGARGRLERSLRIKAAVFGTEEHPSVATSLHSLAGVLFAQGDLGGARERLERSLRIWAAVFGTEEHPSVAASLHSLAGVLLAQGDLAGARDRLERSLRIWAAVFGTEEHPDVATSLHELARVLQAQGDLGGARERLERSLRIKAKVFGTEEHPEVAVSLNNLAGVLQQQGDLAGARKMLERSLQIKAVVFGTDEHPEVAVSLHLLAMVMWSEGLRTRAVGTLRKVLAIEVKLYGTRDHYLTAQTEEVLGQFLIMTGERAEGIGMLDHAFRVYAAALGPTHPDTRQIGELLAKLKGGRVGPAPEARSLQARIQSALGAAQAGDVAGATEALNALLSEVTEAKNLGAEASVRGLMGTLFAATGDPAKARPHLARALMIAKATGQSDAAQRFQQQLNALG